MIPWPKLPFLAKFRVQKEPKATSPAQIPLFLPILASIPKQKISNNFLTLFNKK
jgi:hypothetical protein